MLRRDLIQLGWKKRLLTFLVGCAIFPLRVWASFMTNKPPRERFFVLEPFGLGDVISLEPLIRALRKEGEVMLCAKSAWRELYPNLDWMDAVLPWSAYDPKQKYGWNQYVSPEFRGYLRHLRSKAKGSVGIDTRGDVRSVLLLYLVGCREVRTLSHYLGTDVKNPSWIGTIIPFHHDFRRWQNNLQFSPEIKASGMPGCGPTFEHFTVRVASQEGEKVIGLLPVAPWDGKLWPVDNWKKLAEQLRGNGWIVRVLCGPGQATAAERASGLSSEDVVECGSLGQWADQLSALTAFVTLDSGPMHLADALRVPTIALFGQGILPLWAPSGEKSRVVSHQADADFQQCHPIPRNTEYARQFMARIKVEEVIRAMRALGFLQDHDRKDG